MSEVTELTTTRRLDNKVMTTLAACDGMTGMGHALLYHTENLMKEIRYKKDHHGGELQEYHCRHERRSR